MATFLCPGITSLVKHSRIVIFCNKCHTIISSYSFVNVNNLYWTTVNVQKRHLVITSFSPISLTQCYVYIQRHIYTHIFTGRYLSVFLSFPKPQFQSLLGRVGERIGELVIPTTTPTTTCKEQFGWENCLRSTVFALGLSSLEAYLQLREQKQGCTVCSILIKHTSENAELPMISNIQPLQKLVQNIDVFNLLIGFLFLNLGRNKQSSNYCDNKSISNINVLTH